jgi:hypothetical protein
MNAGCWGVGVAMEISPGTLVPRLTVTGQWALPEALDDRITVGTELSARSAASCAARFGVLVALVTVYPHGVPGHPASRLGGGADGRCWSWPAGGSADG